MYGFFERHFRVTDVFLVANIVLEDTFERHFSGKKFGDIPLGLYIIRGENIVIAGELVSTVSAVKNFITLMKPCLPILQDPEKEEELAAANKVSVEEILQVRSVLFVWRVYLWRLPWCFQLEKDAGDADASASQVSRAWDE